jgi:hypothetical protein
MMVSVCAIAAAARLGILLARDVIEFFDKSGISTVKTQFLPRIYPCAINKCRNMTENSTNDIAHPVLGPDCKIAGD